jgi:hypothetical protein
MSSIQIIVLVVVIVVVVALATVGWMLARRAQLRRRFGPEYDRLVQEQGSRMAAERELRERQRRHAELTIQPLSDEARTRCTTAWEHIQARFIDTPAEAVGEADGLVTQVMAERGYPADGFENQAAQLSVEHGQTIGHYRDAHDVYLRNERGEATTEQLRQALVHYRALVADLLGVDPSAATPGAAAADGAAPIPQPAGDSRQPAPAEADASTQPSPAEAEASAEPAPAEADASAQPAPSPAQPAGDPDREERMHHA